MSFHSGVFDSDRRFFHCSLDYLTGRQDEFGNIRSSVEASNERAFLKLKGTSSVGHRTRYQINFFKFCSNFRTRFKL